MAGTIDFSLSQQLDREGKPLSLGRLYLYRAGTVSTPQNAFYDAALTLPLQWPIVLTSSGRIPFFYLADGLIKISLIDEHGTTQITSDNIPVVGSSSGGGGGGTVDPTTVLQTGWLQPIYGTGVVSGFVRVNGRTIGSATSGATERANADTQALFTFLYNADANLAVSGGRGASAAADYAANKTIALPDFRGRVLAGLDDMGNSAASRLTATYFGTSAIVLGAAGGAESKTLLTANLPAYTPVGSITVTSPVRNNNNVSGGTDTNFLALSNNGNADAGTFSHGTPPGAKSFAGTAQGGTSTPFDKTQPTILVTYYLKL